MSVFESDGDVEHRHIKINGSQFISPVTRDRWLLDEVKKLSQEYNKIINEKEHQWYEVAFTPFPMLSSIDPWALRGFYQVEKFEVGLDSELGLAIVDKFSKPDFDLNDHTAAWSTDFKCKNILSATIIDDQVHVVNPIEDNDGVVIADIKNKYIMETRLHRDSTNSTQRTLYFKSEEQMQSRDMYE